MAEAAFRHIMPLQIRFGDLDIQSHVNNGVYQSFYVTAQVEYTREVLDTREYYEQGWLTVDVRTQFMAPISLDDKVQVETRVAELGTKSFVFEQRITGSQDGKLYSQSRAQFVCFSGPLGKSVPLHPGWREKITAYEITPPLQK